MSNQAVTEGQSVTFEAEVSGVPMPSLGWQKDGRQIYAGGDHYQVNNHHDLHRSSSSSSSSVAVELPRTEVQRHQNTISGTSDHRRRTLMVAFDSPG